MGALQSILRNYRVVLARRDNRLGIKLWERGDLEAAQTALRRATRRHPEYASALSNLGMVLIECGQQEEGLALLRRAVEVDPRHAGALNNLGVAMILGNNPVAAVQHLQAAIDADPQLSEAHANLLGPLMEICAWPALDLKVKEILALAERSPPGVWAERVRPFDLLALPVPRELQRAAGRHYAAKLARGVSGARAAPAPPAANRLRIGYVSSDFRNHATTHLCVGLFGRHDRSRFEVTAYSFGPGDGSVYRRRIEAESEHFVDISALSLEEAVQRIARDGIHILVDMKGYTGGGRPEIFARRPAPIQINYLGYPESMQAPFMDYIVGDRVVIPEADAGDWYSEAVAWFPGAYQINDREQAIDERTPSRAEQGLPERGFVYCCFNNNYKVEPRIFSSWMRILREVPDSVLWLYRSNVPAKYALWKAAERHGVERRRLVFASSLPKPQHLARLRLADLFLDTHYYNAHTTTTDALWAGVPVLTWPGETFASRVAASLLTAVGLPDLIAPSQQAYERRAIALAAEPQALAALRSRLAVNRLSTPLFDTGAHVRHLESAFETMWATRTRGERPRSFQVAP